MLKSHAERALGATEILDCDTAIVQDYTKRIVGAARDPVEQAIKLFYAVRDTIRYDVYGIDMSRVGMKASSIIKNGVGFCIHKSIVFAAAARCLGIPSQLAFADVRNHLSTAALREILGGDVFHYHSYAEIYLNERWIKVTPVFNLKLCYLFGLDPLDFDGVKDATLQLYDKQGNQYMEFVHHHGTFVDFPYEQCIAALKLHHPRLFMDGRQTIGGDLTKERRLEAINQCTPSGS
jgi:transglutaminase-like putative cysteine protease